MNIAMSAALMSGGEKGEDNKGNNGRDNNGKNGKHTLMMCRSSLEKMIRKLYDECSIEKVNIQLILLMLAIQCDNEAIVRYLITLVNYKSKTPIFSFSFIYASFYNSENVYKWLYSKHKFDHKTFITALSAFIKSGSCAGDITLPFCSEVDLARYRLKTCDDIEAIELHEILISNLLSFHCELSLKYISFYETSIWLYKRYKEKISEECAIIFMSDKNIPVYVTCASGFSRESKVWIELKNLTDLNDFDINNHRKTISKWILRKAYSLENLQLIYIPYFALCNYSIEYLKFNNGNIGPPEYEQNDHIFKELTIDHNTILHLVIWNNSHFGRTPLMNAILSGIFLFFRIIENAFCNKRL